MDSPIIQSFLEHLKSERRLSRHTIISYQTDLDQFSNYLQLAGLATEEKILWEEIQSRDIKNWIIELSEQNILANSINRKLACLRTFFKYLIRNKLINQDCMKGVKMLKTPKKLPQFIRETESQNLIEKPAESEFPSLRDHLCLLLLYGTGIRLSELIQLKNSDINPFESTIKVLGKRNKERIIPIPISLLTLIKEYQTKKNGESDYLLITDKGEPLYPVFVQRLIKKALKNIKNLEKKSPHVLRHTYATHLLNHGADLNAIKELLGHSNLAATQVYTHNSLEKIKSIYNQAHPKGGN